jgi:hypothetical protein
MHFFFIKYLHLQYEANRRDRSSRSSSPRLSGIPGIGSGLWRKPLN